jgi:hypothetical protein
VSRGEGFGDGFGDSDFKSLKRFSLSFLLFAFLDALSLCILLVLGKLIGFDTGLKSCINSSMKLFIFFE